MRPLLIADIGSLWGVSLDTALQAARAVCLAGYRPKFQLCAAAAGNIPLPAEYLPALIEALPNVSASVWDIQGVEALIQAGAAWIKLAWSSPRILLKYCTLPTIITLHAHEYMAPRRNLYRLVTAEDHGQPIYPDSSQALPKQAHTDSSGDRLYPDQAEGFSCHGSVQDAMDAIDAGASIIELHANPLALPRDWAPDARFAWTMADLESLILRIKART